MSTNNKVLFEISKDDNNNKFIVKEVNKEDLCNDNGASMARNTNANASSSELPKFPNENDLNNLLNTQTSNVNSRRNTLANIENSRSNAQTSNIDSRRNTLSEDNEEYNYTKIINKIYLEFIENLELINTNSKLSSFKNLINEFNFKDIENNLLKIKKINDNVLKPFIENITILIKPIYDKLTSLTSDNEVSDFFNKFIEINNENIYEK